MNQKSFKILLFFIIIFIFLILLFKSFSQQIQPPLPPSSPDGGDSPNIQAKSVPSKEYDANNNLIKETFFAFDKEIYRIEKEYDANNNLIKETVFSFDKITEIKEYDTDKKLIKKTIFASTKSTTQPYVIIIDNNDGTYKETIYNVVDGSIIATYTYRRNESIKNDFSQ